MKTKNPIVAVFEDLKPPEAPISKEMAGAMVTSRLRITLHTSAPSPKQLLMTTYC